MVILPVICLPILKSCLHLIIFVAIPVVIVLLFIN